MRITSQQQTTKTLADLLRALDHRNAVTVTYRDREGAITVRTVELHEVHAKAGDYELIVMCRLENAERHLSLSGILAYTVHRMAYVLTRPEPTTYERPAPAPADDADALYTYELERDPDDANYRPRRKLVRADTDLAA
jgi:predicted DNA-binding transcriptional regulator YafY